MDLIQLREYIGNYFGIDISKKTRKKQYIIARCIYYKIAGQLDNYYTLSQIGKSIGKDHSTVLHGNKTFESFYSSRDNALMKHYSIIYKNLEKYFKEIDIKKVDFTSKGKKIDLKVLDQIHKQNLDIVKAEYKNIIMSLEKEITKKDKLLSEISNGKTLFKKLSKLSEEQLIDFEKNRIDPYLKMLHINI